MTDPAPEPSIDADGVGWCSEGCFACSHNENAEWFCKFRSGIIISTGMSACPCLPYARQQAERIKELEAVGCVTNAPTLQGRRNEKHYLHSDRFNIFVHGDSHNLHAEND